MIRNVWTSVVIVAALTLSGCGFSGSVSTSTGSGGQITNRNGHITGTLAAINVTLDIRAAGNSTFGTGHHSSSSIGRSGSTEFNRWEITAGEMLIVFERTDDGPISLIIDEQDYGTINEGDELLVDEQRQVFVNGQPRSSSQVDGVAP